jgi:polyphosphate kinase 2 (PPK2 family)
MSAHPLVGVPSQRLGRADYEHHLERLQRELVKLQEWVVHEGLRVCVLFEGRDAAGEIVLLDRSWYNRAGVERVMGFCTEDEYEEFLRATPALEAMLLRSGIILVKYWFSVSDREQERRFQERIRNPRKRWKLSEMDLQSRARWVDYSRAKDRMFELTDTKLSPWWVVQADDKRQARLDCISHLLSLVPYQDLTSKPLVLPPRQTDDYVRPPEAELSTVPQGDWAGRPVKAPRRRG